jgi:acyl-coenzyme A synthetase/AMP-(fatty) acid ligase
MNILDLCAGEPQSSALVAPEYPTLTYQQLKTNVTALVGQLHQFGLGEGDRIAIAMSNGAPMVIAFLAAALCGSRRVIGILCKSGSKERICVDSNTQYTKF